MYEATGSRELYQPIQSCHVICLGISNKSVAVYTQTGQYSPLLRGSCCPVWALQYIYIYIYNIIYIVYTCMYMYSVCHDPCCQGFCIVEVVNGHLGT